MIWLIALFYICGISILLTSHQMLKGDIDTATMFISLFWPALFIVIGTGLILQNLLAMLPGAKKE